MTALLPRSPVSRAVLVALLAAILGGVAGWALAWPVYRAEGLLAAAPGSATNLLLPPCPWRGNPPDVLAAALASSRRVTLLALECPTWQDTGEDAGKDAVDDFEARRRILPLTQSPHVLVTFDHARPEVALAGVRALLETAEQLAAELYEHEDAEVGAQLAAEREKAASLAGERDGLTRKTLELAEEYGGVEGLALRHRATLELLLATEKDLAEVRDAILRGRTPEGPSLEELTEYANVLTQRLEVLRERARMLGSRQDEVARVQRQEAKLAAALIAMDDMLASLERGRVGEACLRVEDRGTLPIAPLRNVRTSSAAVGAGAGWLLGLLLASALSRRARGG